MKKYAAISAFQDDRFMSITMEDLPNLRCDVTLLHDFRPMRDINDFEIGKDGVSLTVTLPSGREVSSCFLPSVICEAGRVAPFARLGRFIVLTCAPLRSFPRLESCRNAGKPID